MCNFCKIEIYRLFLLKKCIIFLNRKYAYISWRKCARFLKTYTMHFFACIKNADKFPYKCLLLIYSITQLHTIHTFCNKKCKHFLILKNSHKHFLSMLKSVNKNTTNV